VFRTWTSALYIIPSRLHRIETKNTFGARKSSFSRRKCIYLQRSAHNIFDHGIYQLVTHTARLSQGLFKEATRELVRLSCRHGKQTPHLEATHKRGSFAARPSAPTRSSLISAVAYSSRPFGPAHGDRSAFVTIARATSSVGVALALCGSIQLGHIFWKIHSAGRLSSRSVNSMPCGTATTSTNRSISMSM